MDHLRKNEIPAVGEFKVSEKIDRWKGEPQPHLSRTDTSSRNVLILKLADLPETRSIRITVRPSGTEPKFKIYIEVLGRPFDLSAMDAAKQQIVQIQEQLERDFMAYCYRILGVDFPERGFLLFWQLPLDDKMKYFEVEEKIAGLKTVSDAAGRKRQLENLLNFLGANPVQKVDRAFAARYGSGITAYLDLE
jgi:phosphoglucomutase/phosphomannomutase